jgi:hypothetical protein
VEISLCGEFFMKSFWERVKETLKQKASSFGEKVNEYSHFSALSVEKYNLTKQAEKLMSDLGGKAYTLFSEKRIDELGDDEEALNYLLKIRGIENEIKEVEEKIKNLKSEQKNPSG